NLRADAAIDKASDMNVGCFARRERCAQERALDPDDVVPRVLVPRPDGIRDRGSTSARILRQAPDRPADALVRAMARPGTAGAGSGWSRTRPIHPAPFRAPLERYPNALNRRASRGCWTPLPRS